MLLCVCYYVLSDKMSSSFISYQPTIVRAYLAKNLWCATRYESRSNCWTFSLLTLLLYVLPSHELATSDSLLALHFVGLQSAQIPSDLRSPSGSLEVAHYSPRSAGILDENRGMQLEDDMYDTLYPPHRMGIPDIAV